MTERLVELLLRIDLIKRFASLHRCEKDLLMLTILFIVSSIYEIKLFAFHLLASFPKKILSLEKASRELLTKRSCIESMSKMYFSL